MGYNTSIIFGTLTIEASDVNLTKVPGTRKQIVGGIVVPISIPDRGTKDWRGIIRGSFSDASRNNDRDTLQAMFDNNNLVKLVDGIHDGDYYILRPLRWPDNHLRPNEHMFIMEIIQEN